MDKKYIMTIDFGTQSVRAAIVDTEGNIVGISQLKYPEPYFSLKPGYAEQNPDLYYTYLSVTSKKLWEEYPTYKDKVIGVAMSCFRDTAVLCDENMNPVRPAFLWLDQRLASGKNKLPFSHRLLFKLAGVSETIKLNRSRTPAQWIMENEPDVWKKTKRYMNISTYITYRICGEYKDSPSNYAGHFPTDFKHFCFYTKENDLSGSIFGIPLNLLCELVPVGEVIGKTTKKCEEETGIPEGLSMFSIGSDKSCETLGLGAMEPGIAAISCGTASTIEISSKKFCHPAPFLPSYPSVVPGYYNCEVQVYRGYWMIGWFIRNFALKEIELAEKEGICPEEYLDRLLPKIPAGSGGLIIQPYWGPGLSRPISRGAVIGFSDSSTKMHFYRAIIEGIDYELKEGLKAMEKSSGVPVTSLRISGGGSQSDEICQICADVFNLPTSRVQTFETSTIGAAMAGFLGAGIFKDVDEATKKMVHPAKPFMPDKNNAKKYKYLFEHCYLKLYPSLKEIYHNIRYSNFLDK